MKRMRRTGESGYDLVIDLLEELTLKGCRLGVHLVQLGFYELDVGTILIAEGDIPTVTYGFQLAEPLKVTDAEPLTPLKVISGSLVSLGTSDPYKRVYSSVSSLEFRNVRLPDYNELMVYYKKSIV